MPTNTKIGLRIGLFAAWLILSFCAVYYLIAGEHYIASWRFASTAFMWYLLTMFPVSIIGAFMLIRRHVSGTLRQLRILISMAGIFLIIGFTLVQWTTLTTRYGNIEAFEYDRGSELLMLDKETDTLSLFERKTLFRETITAYYDLTFKKILMFGILISTFTFMALKAVDKRG